MKNLNIFKKMILLALGFLLISSAAAQVSIKFPSQLCLSEKAFLDTCKPLMVSGEYYEASKDAIVLITHGSQGLDERHQRYAKYLQSLGISSVILEHWKSRGVWDVQRDFVRFARAGANSHNMILDIQHAVNYFKSQGYKKFGFIGESMGGGVAVLLTKHEWQNHFSRVSGLKPNQFDAIVGLYGNCNERYSYDAYLPVPMIMITGELDANTPAKTCKDYIAEWANVRGAKMEFLELPGQHHDFDAGFPLQKSNNAQNPAKCISQVDLNNIKSTLTGAVYPNTPAGWDEWRKSCLMKPNEIDVRYGHTGNPNTGFNEWGNFFAKYLLK